MEAAGIKPNPLETSLSNLHQAYYQCPEGKTADPNQARQIARNLQILYLGLGQHHAKDPDIQTIFQKIGPLAKDPNTGKTLIHDPKILDLVYPQRQKPGRSLKKTLINAGLAAGVLATGTGILLTKEIADLRASGGPPPISYDKDKLFRGDKTLTLEPEQTPQSTQTVRPIETSTASPTKNPPPVPTKTPESTKPQENLFNEFIKPFIEEAQKRKAEREKNDPEYSKRIDKQLNENRINFLLFSYGENYDLNTGQIENVGTDQILSLNTKTNELDLISITHDTRAPETEQYLKQLGKETYPMKIDTPYAVGGFDLMRKTFEDATGLSMDFQAVLQDTAIQRLTDKVLNGLEVDIPATFTADKIALGGKVYDRTIFEKGKHKLNGAQAVQFMKGADTAGYIPERGPHQRKHVILSAIKESFQNNFLNPLFWSRLLTYFNDEKAKEGGIQFDFDETRLLPNIFQVSSTFLRTREVGSFSVGKSIFIMDSAIGDGGVQWVTANAVENPKTKTEIDKGVYRDLSMEIPLNADPNSNDLVKDYWQSVRRLIKQKLEENPTVTLTATPTPETKADLPKKEDRILYPAELAYPEVRKWLGKLRNSHDAVLTESAFTQELAGLPTIKRQEILETIAQAHVKTLIDHYGDTDAIIGLDPGHGGSDIGSSGTTADGERLTEKNLTWQICKIIADKIYQQTQSKYTVVMLRPENPHDEDLDHDGNISAIERLQKRKALLLETEEKLRPDPAKRGKNIVYLSVHLNGSPDPSQKGAETFWPNSAAVGDANRRESSKQLAQGLQQEIVSATRQTGYEIANRGSKEDPDNREPLNNSDPTTGPYVALGSKKLDRDMENGRVINIAQLPFD